MSLAPAMPFRIKKKKAVNLAIPLEPSSQTLLPLHIFQAIMILRMEVSPSSDFHGYWRLIWKNYLHKENPKLMIKIHSCLIFSSLKKVLISCLN